THLCFELRNKSGKVVRSIPRAGFSDSAALLTFAFLALRTRIGDARDEADLIDALDDTRRRYSVLAIVRLLQLAAAIGLLDAALHRARHPVGVEDGRSEERRVGKEGRSR